MAAVRQEAVVTLEQLLSFVAVAVAVAVIPGPDMALVARNVVLAGTRGGYATSLGICTGILGWALAAVGGVTAILATSAVAFTMLKLAGAAYLVVLGIRTLRASDAPPLADDAAGRRLPATLAWRQGLVSALLNPKLGVFFLTLLPQFVPPGVAGPLVALQLAVLFDAIGLAWLLAYATLLGLLRAALDGPGPRRAIRRVTGTVLIALGVRVALEPR